MEVDHGQTAITGPSASDRGLCGGGAFPPSFVVELMKRCRETGSLGPARQGRPPGGRLTPLQGYLIQTVEARPDITMPELAELVQAVHEVGADPSWFSRCLISLWFSYEKIPDRDGARTRAGPARAPRPDSSAPAPDARRAASAGVSR